MEKINSRNNPIVFDEYSIVQNSLLGTHALYEFTTSYQNKDESGMGIKLPLCFILLPIVFNKEYTNEIYRKNYSRGSFIKVLNSKELLFEGIQKRMEDLAPTTFRSLNIGFDSNLLLYDTQTRRIAINKKQRISYSKKSDRGYQKIILASKRLGAWFAQIEEEQILSYLHIQF